MGSGRDPPSRPSASPGIGRLAQLSARVPSSRCRRCPPCSPCAPPLSRLDVGLDPPRPPRPPRSCRPSSTACPPSRAPRRTCPRTPTSEQLADQIRQLHQHVATPTPPSPPQDDFRHLRGFQTLLNLLRSFSGFYNPRKRTESERRAVFDLLHVVLATLSAAFRGHPGNRRYFRDRVEGGGWKAWGRS